MILARQAAEVAGGHVEAREQAAQRIARYRHRLAHRRALCPRAGAGAKQRDSPQGQVAARIAAAHLGGGTVDAQAAAAVNHMVVGDDGTARHAYAAATAVGLGRRRDRAAGSEAKAPAPAAFQRVALLDCAAVLGFQLRAEA